MPSIALFVSMALTLLLVPGPTNTVLAVAGATRGLRASLLLPLAELLGYFTAIHLLAFTLGGLVQGHPQAQAALRLVLALYLFWLAVSLWRAAASGGPAPVTPLRVFTVTLLNPKALVFAFMILPPLAAGWLAALPYLLLLAGLILFASLCWIALGAAVHAGKLAWLKPLHVRRAAALVLAGFALALVLPAVTALTWQ